MLEGGILTGSLPDCALVRCEFQSREVLCQSSRYRSHRWNIWSKSRKLKDNQSSMEDWTCQKWSINKQKKKKNVEIKWGGNANNMETNTEISVHSKKMLYLQNWRWNGKINKYLNAKLNNEISIKSHFIN